MRRSDPYRYAAKVVERLSLTGRTVDRDRKICYNRTVVFGSHLLPTGEKSVGGPFVMIVTVTDEQIGKIEYEESGFGRITLRVGA